MNKHKKTIKLSRKGHGHKEIHIYEDDDDGDVTIDFGNPEIPGSGQTIWLKCRCGTEEAIEWLTANLEDISYRWD